MFSDMFSRSRSHESLITLTHFRAQDSEKNSESFIFCLNANALNVCFFLPFTFLVTFLSLQFLNVLLFVIATAIDMNFHLNTEVQKTKVSE